MFRRSPLFRSRNTKRGKEPKEPASDEEILMFSKEFIRSELTEVIHDAELLRLLKQTVRATVRSAVAELFLDTPHVFREEEERCPLLNHRRRSDATSPSSFRVSRSFHASDLL